MKVEYDGHGVTGHCPQFGEQVSNECLACPFFKGREGFVVDCIYLESSWDNFDELMARALLEA